MSKPDNKRRGEVGMPEAGEGVVLRFTVDAMERLFSEYGEKYVDHVIRSLAQLNPKVFKTTIECLAEGEYDIEDLPWGMTWNDLNNRCLDAIYLSLHGKTFEAYREELEKRADEEYEAAKLNPRKAVNLLSKLSSELGALPDSDQKKSAD